MDELVERVAVNLRRLRETRGLTVSQLASRSGVAKSTLSQIESKTTNPTLGTLAAIASSFSVSVEELLAADERESTVVVRAGIGHDVSGSSIEGVLALAKELGPSTIEFHALSLPKGGHEISPSHGSGSREYVLVTSGTVSLGPEGERHELSVGDLASYPTAGLHHWENIGDTTATFWVVALYPHN